MKQYKTIQGDTWEMIAHKQMGDSLLMDLLMKANPQYLSFFVFPAGVVLVIPDIPETAEVDASVPWMQEDEEDE